MSGHTELPWEVDGIDVRADGPSGRQIALCEISVRGRPYNETYDEAIANAAFIVRACNSHEALMNFVREIASLSPHQFERSEDPCWVIDEARKLMGALASVQS